MTVTVWTSALASVHAAAAGSPRRADGSRGGTTRPGMRSPRPSGNECSNSAWRMRPDCQSAGAVR
jgi:hypothetical protein